MFVIERTLMFVFFFIFFSFSIISIKHHLLVDRESRRDKQDEPI